MVTKKTSQGATGVKSPQSIDKPAKVGAKPVKSTAIKSKAIAKPPGPSSAKNKVSVVSPVAVRPSKTKVTAVKSAVVKRAVAKKLSDNKTVVKKTDVKKGSAKSPKHVDKSAGNPVAKTNPATKTKVADKLPPVKVKIASTVKVEPVKKSLKSRLMSPIKKAVAKLTPKPETKAVETKKIAVKYSTEKSALQLDNQKITTVIAETSTKLKSTKLKKVTKPVAQSLINTQAHLLSKKNETKKAPAKKQKLIMSQSEGEATAVRRVAIGKTAVMKPQPPASSTSSKGSISVNIDMTDEAVLSPSSKESVKAAKAEKIIKTKSNKNSGDSPADFKPYQVGSDEEYMNAGQLSHFRELLNKWKQELMEEVDRTVHHMQDESANLPDPADRATQEEEFTFELRTRDRERKLIKKIDQALEALDDNDYGYCESCGVEIGIRRLEARPTATLCIDCKTLDEIKEKQLRGS